MADNKKKKSDDGTSARPDHLFTAGNMVAKKHGLHAFQERGEASLEPQQISRLAEIRQMVKDTPGRLELRNELTARMSMICELGFAHLAEEAKNGHDIWTSGVIKRLATYVAETRRLLDGYADEVPRGTATEIILQKMREHGDEEE